MTVAPDRLLRLPEVLALIGLSRPELYRRMKRPASDSGFPRQVKLGRASAWPESEVLAWVEARKAERTAA
ncbi:helix-turn-helix transcriptional regulator [Pseudorhodobacter sp. W20_MBD10_FR17]|uniref:helix-turn-helix transcriptional regulator n=1 Tax=Pseudorhodobacter sp. W20_MBD10_FR17 TaxID=3240266 RepID=UPI003F9A398F